MGKTKDSVQPEESSNMSIDDPSGSSAARLSSANEGCFVDQLKPSSVHLGKTGDDVLTDCGPETESETAAEECKIQPPELQNELCGSMHVKETESETATEERKIQSPELQNEFCDSMHVKETESETAAEERKIQSPELQNEFCGSMHVKETESETATEERKIQSPELQNEFCGSMDVKESESDSLVQLSESDSSDVKCDVKVFTDCCPETESETAEEERKIQSPELQNEFCGSMHVKETESETAAKECKIQSPELQNKFCGSMHVKETESDSLVQLRESDSSYVKCDVEVLRSLTQQRTVRKHAIADYLQTSALEKVKLSELSTSVLQNENSMNAKNSSLIPEVRVSLTPIDPLLVPNKSALPGKSAVKSPTEKKPVFNELTGLSLSPVSKASPEVAVASQSKRLHGTLSKTPGKLYPETHRNVCSDRMPVVSLCRKSAEGCSGCLKVSQNSPSYRTKFVKKEELLPVTVKSETYGDKTKKAPPVQKLRNPVTPSTSTRTSTPPKRAPLITRQPEAIPGQSKLLTRCLETPQNCITLKINILKKKEPLPVTLKPRTHGDKILQKKTPSVQNLRNLATSSTSVPPNRAPLTTGQPAAISGPSGLFTSDSLDSRTTENVDFENEQVISNWLNSDPTQNDEMDCESQMFSDGDASENDEGYNTRPLRTPEKHYIADENMDTSDWLRTLLTDEDATATETETSHQGRSADNARFNLGSTPEKSQFRLMWHSSVDSNPPVIPRKYGTTLPVPDSFSPAKNSRLGRPVKKCSSQKACGAKLLFQKAKSLVSRFAVQTTNAALRKELTSKILEVDLCPKRNGYCNRRIRGSQVATRRASVEKLPARISDTMVIFSESSSDDSDDLIQKVIASESLSGKKKILTSPRNRSLCRKSFHPYKEKVKVKQISQPGQVSVIVQAQNDVQLCQYCGYPIKGNVSMAVHQKLCKRRLETGKSVNSYHCVVSQPAPVTPTPLASYVSLNQVLEKENEDMKHLKSELKQLKSLEAQLKNNIKSQRDKLKLLKNRARLNKSVSKLTTLLTGSAGMQDALNSPEMSIPAQALETPPDSLMQALAGPVSLSPHLDSLQALSQQVDSLVNRDQGMLEQQQLQNFVLQPSKEMSSQISQLPPNNQNMQSSSSDVLSRQPSLVPETSLQTLLSQPLMMPTPQISQISFSSPGIAAQNQQLLSLASGVSQYQRPMPRPPLFPSESTVPVPQQPQIDLEDPSTAQPKSYFPPYPSDSLTSPYSQLMSPMSTLTQQPPSSGSRASQYPKTMPRPPLFPTESTVSVSQIDLEDPSAAQLKPYFPAFPSASLRTPYSESGSTLSAKVSSPMLQQKTATTTNVPKSSTDQVTCKQRSRIFQCIICAKMFTGKSFLEKHLLMKHQKFMTPDDVIGCDTFIDTPPKITLPQSGHKEVALKQISTYSMKNRSISDTSLILGKQDVQKSTIGKDLDKDVFLPTEDIFSRRKDVGPRRVNDSAESESCSVLNESIPPRPDAVMSQKDVVEAFRDGSGEDNLTRDKRISDMNSTKVTENAVFDSPERTKGTTEQKAISDSDYDDNGDVYDNNDSDDDDGEEIAVPIQDQSSDSIRLSQLETTSKNTDTTQNETDITVEKDVTMSPSRPGSSEGEEAHVICLRLFEPLQPNQKPVSDEKTSDEDTIRKKYYKTKAGNTTCKEKAKTPACTGAASTEKDVMAAKSSTSSPGEVIPLNHGAPVQPQQVNKPVSSEKTQDEGTFRIKCVVCGEEFLNRKALRTHLKFAKCIFRNRKAKKKLIHGAPVQPQQKPVSSEKTSDEGTFRIKCVVCGEEFLNQKALRTHLKFAKCMFRNLKAKKKALKYSKTKAGPSMKAKGVMATKCCRGSRGAVIPLNRGAPVQPQQKSVSPEEPSDTIKDTPKDTPKDTAKIKCTICRRKFFTESSLEGHMKYHMGKRREFIGDSPEEVVSLNQEAPVQPQQPKKPQAKERFVCDHSQCGESFVSIRTLNKHLLNSHVVPEPWATDTSHKSKVKKFTGNLWRQGHKWKCKHCAEIFPLRYLLEKHVEQTKHGIALLGVPEKTNSVETTDPKSKKEVSKTFIPTSIKANKDLKLSELQNISLECTHCELTFNSRELLIEHLYAAHGVETGTHQPLQQQASVDCTDVQEQQQQPQNSSVTELSFPKKTGIPMFPSTSRTQRQHMGSPVAALSRSHGSERAVVARSSQELVLPQELSSPVPIGIFLNQTVTDNTQVIQCKVCMQIFTEQISLEEHLQVRHNQVEAPEVEEISRNVLNTSDDAEGPLDITLNESNASVGETGSPSTFKVIETPLCGDRCITPNRGEIKTCKATAEEDHIAALFNIGVESETKKMASQLLKSKQTFALDGETSPDKNIVAEGETPAFEEVGKTSASVVIDISADGDSSSDSFDGDGNDEDNDCILNEIIVSVNSETPKKLNDFSEESDNISPADKAITDETVSVADTDAIKDKTVSVVETDSITDKTVTVAETDAITDKTVTVAETDAIKDKTVTVAETDAITGKTVTVSETDAITDKTMSVAETDAITDKTVTVADSDAITEKTVSVSETDGKPDKNVAEPEIEVLSEKTVAEAEVEVLPNKNVSATDKLNASRCMSRRRLPDSPDSPDAASLGLQLLVRNAGNVDVRNRRTGPASGQQNQLAKYFTCSQCNKHFMSQEFLDKHIEKKHYTVQSQLVKNSANLDPRNRGAAPVSGQENQQPKYFTCSQCNKKFMSQEFLDKHIEKKHNTVQSQKPASSVQCEVAAKLSGNDEFLRKHMEENHCMDSKIKGSGKKRARSLEPETTRKQLKTDNARNVIPCSEVMDIILPVWDKNNSPNKDITSSFNKSGGQGASVSVFLDVPFKELAQSREKSETGIILSDMVFNNPPGQHGDHSYCDISSKKGVSPSRKNYDLLGKNVHLTSSSTSICPSENVSVSPSEAHLNMLQGNTKADVSLKEDLASDKEAASNPSVIGSNVNISSKDNTITSGGVDTLNSSDNPGEEDFTVVQNLDSDSDDSDEDVVIDKVIISLDSIPRSGRGSSAVDNTAKEMGVVPDKTDGTPDKDVVLTKTLQNSSSMNSVESVGQIIPFQQPELGENVDTGCVECGKCGKCFKSLDYLDKHIQKKHETPQPEVKGISRSEKTKKSADDGKFTDQGSSGVKSEDNGKTAEKTPNAVKCRFCTKAFMDEHFLTRHMEKRHPNNNSKAKSKRKKRLKDSYPDLATIDITVVKDLKLSELPNINLECTHCSKTFNRRQLLIEHLANRHSVL